MRTELFRPAAVAAHTEAAAAGRSLPSSRRMLTQATLALAAALIAVLGLAKVVEIDETAEGTWTTSGDSASVTMPAGASGRIRIGQTVRFEDQDIDAFVFTPPERIVVGADGKPIAFVPVVIHGPLPPNRSGKAVVVLDRRSVLDLVVDAFGRGFRRG